MPLFEADHYQNNQQSPRRPNIIPSAITVHTLDASQPSPDTYASIHPTDTNSPQMTTISKKSDAILLQLWGLIQQLEEIITQFTLFLDTLLLPKPSMQLSQPSGEQSNPLATLKENPPSSITTQVIPQLPPPAFSCLHGLIYPCMPTWPHGLLL